MGRSVSDDPKNVILRVRLTQAEDEELDALATKYTRTKSDLVREALALVRHGVLSNTKNPVLAKLKILRGSRLTDRQILLTKNEIQTLSLLDLETALLPELTALLLSHVSSFGWFYPEETETFEKAQERLVAGRANAGSAFLKSSFRSFWDAPGGAASAFRDPKALTSVLRSRIGLRRDRMCFDLSLKEVRKGFVVQHRTLSFFKPSWAFALYKKWLSGTSPVVWDPSCGFGARILAFYTAFPGGKYIGHEPASATFDDLTRLAKTMAVTPDLIKAGSETAKLIPESLDLVFTSPPYFDLEDYGSEPALCANRFKTRLAWENGFVEPVLSQAFLALKPGKHAVFNVDAQRQDAFEARAKKVGFELRQVDHIALKSDPFQRKAGRLDRREPVLVFRKPE